MNLSIIIPAYNVEQYLSKCLDSILTQESADFEVICINDGSIDGTAELLAKYSQGHENLSLINQPNMGMSASRNRGLKLAKGEYVMFVDSDDWLESDSLKRLVETANGEDVIEFQCRKYFDDEDRYSTSDRPNVMQRSTGWDYFNKERLKPRDIHFVCIWQRIYRREFLLKNNLFFDESVRRAEDDLFSTMVMWYAASLKVIPLEVYVYRVRPNSITTTISLERWKDSLKVQDILLNFFIGRTDADVSVVFQVLASNYITCFSLNTLKLYGNQDAFLYGWVNWTFFKSILVTKRHKMLYRLIKISPALYRFYEKLVSCSILR